MKICYTEDGAVNVGVGDRVFGVDVGARSWAMAVTRGGVVEAVFMGSDAAPALRVAETAGGLAVSIARDVRLEVDPEGRVAFRQGGEVTRWA